LLNFDAKAAADGEATAPFLRGAQLEVQEEAEEYATMHHDINLRKKIDFLKEQQRNIIGEEAAKLSQGRTLGDRSN
jgi:hypothetical protein